MKSKYWVIRQISTEIEQPKVWLFLWHVNTNYRAYLQKTSFINMLSENQLQEGKAPERIKNLLLNLFSLMRKECLEVFYKKSSLEWLAWKIDIKTIMMIMRRSIHSYLRAMLRHRISVKYMTANWWHNRSKRGSSWKCYDNDQRWMDQVLRFSAFVYH